MGVELGKQLARAILHDLEAAQPGSHDSSTKGLFDYYKSLRK
jgi:glucose-6-phosphate isomerase